MCCIDFSGNSLTYLIILFSIMIFAVIFVRSVQYFQETEQGRARLAKHFEENNYHLNGRVVVFLLVVAILLFIVRSYIIPTILGILGSITLFFSFLSGFLAFQFSSMSAGKLLREGSQNAIFAIALIGGELFMGMIQSYWVGILCWIILSISFFRGYSGRGEFIDFANKTGREIDRDSYFYFVLAWPPLILIFTLADLIIWGSVLPPFVWGVILIPCSIFFMLVGYQGKREN